MVFYAKNRRICLQRKVYRRVPHRIAGLVISTGVKSDEIGIDKLLDMTNSTVEANVAIYMKLSTNDQSSNINMLLHKSHKGEPEYQILN